MDEARLEALLYPARPLAIEIPLPDFAHIQRELSRRGVTRLLLWQEYKAQALLSAYAPISHRRLDCRG